MVVIECIFYLLNGSHRAYVVLLAIKCILYNLNGSHKLYFVFIEW